MKLSEQTVAILENFSRINSGIVIPPDTGVLRTISTDQSIFAKAVVEEKFPHEVAIYKLSDLLTSLEFTKDADLEIVEKAILVRGSGTRTFIRMADKDVIPGFQRALPADVNFPEVGVEFMLEEAVLSKLLQVAGKLNLTDFEITREENNLVFRGFNAKRETENEYQTIIGKTDSTADFSFKYRKDLFLMLPGLYKVSIAKVFPTRFELASTTTKLVYFLAAESDSYFKE